MESLLKATSVCKHFPHATDLILKDCIGGRCSVDGRFVVELSADNIVLCINRKLLLLDMRDGMTSELADLQRWYVIPIGRIARGSFLSIVAIGDSDNYKFKVYTSPGHEETLQNVFTEKAISAFSTAGPNKFVYCSGDGNFRSIYFSGLFAKEIEETVTTFNTVDYIAANGDLTAISSKGGSSVEFWKHKTVHLRAVYEHETICGLGRSKCWIFVQRQRSVVFYSAPYLNQTRLISLREVIPSSCTERWTVNVAPDETFAVIHSGKKLLLYHILSAAFIGEQGLPEGALDVCVLSTGKVLVVMSNMICVVWPSRLSLVKNLHEVKMRNVLGTSDEYQRAMIRTLTNGECAFAFCIYQDSNFSLMHTVDEFIALYHIVVLAAEELLEKKQEDMIETLSCSQIVWKLREAHMEIRQRSKTHHRLVDECVRQLSQYKVCSLDNLDMKLTYHYNHSEDMCILQNTDVFNLREKKHNKEGFVTNFRRIHQMYLILKRRTALAAVAIEIISFTEYYIIGKEDGLHATTSRTTIQHYSNYLLGLQGCEQEKELSTLTSRLFKSTADAIRLVDRLPLHKRYMIIWTEILHDLDMNNQDLAKFFDNNG